MSFGQASSFYIGLSLEQGEISEITYRNKIYVVGIKFLSRPIDILNEYFSSTMKSILKISENISDRVGAFSHTAVFDLLWGARCYEVAYISHGE